MHLGLLFCEKKHPAILQMQGDEVDAYWNSKAFEKHKNCILNFSIREDVRIGIFLVTDYGSAKIMKIS